MKHFEIIGYTYEASIHCEGCTLKRLEEKRGLKT